MADIDNLEMDEKVEFGVRRIFRNKNSNWLEIIISLMAHLLIHRGIVNKKYKENLLKSFKQSFKKGHYGVETDIHATKDQ